jgi:hypothetical protein
MRSKTLKLVLVAALAALATALTLTAVSGAKSGKRDGDRGKSSTKLKANLNGANEVPGPGDPDGSGKAKVLLLPRFNAVCFKLRWENIADPTAAHIHRGAKGVAGPVVVPLFLGTEASPVRERGCTDQVDSALLREIRRNPSGFYVNIHNADFPAGAIRGQLKRADNGRKRGGRKDDDDRKNGGRKDD